MTTATPPIPASARADAAAWMDVASAVLTHAGDAPDRIAAAEASLPGSPAVLAVKGLSLMLAGRRECRDAAGEAAACAQEAVAGSSCTHDAAYVAALLAWRSGAPCRAATILDETLAAHPGDALALKLAQAIRFIRGDAAGMRASSDAVSQFADSHPHAGYVHGCRAFALEETFAFDEALAAGRRALEMSEDDAWGLHAVAHVCEMTGRSEEGRRLIEANRHMTARCTTFRRHVEWHLALFELERGATDRALALYDEAIRAERTDDYRDVANAVSLLVRLQGEGVDVGERWDELAALAERRAADSCLTFADLHYVMALLADGRREAARKMVRRMGEGCAGIEGNGAERNAGAPVAAGLMALAEGRADAALSDLLTARSHLASMGGSHAQRDVFVRLTVDAAVRGGRPDVAIALLEQRAAERGWDRFARSRSDRCANAR